MGHRKRRAFSKAFKVKVALEALRERKAAAEFSRSPLWRSVKYEEVYLNEYVGAVEAWQRLDPYFRYYNFERPHQTLGYTTPANAYFGDSWQLQLSHKDR